MRSAGVIGRPNKAGRAMRGSPVCSFVTGPLLRDPCSDLASFRIQDVALDRVSPPVRARTRARPAMGNFPSSALVRTPALKGEAVPLQARQRPAHGSVLRVAHAAPAVRECDRAIDLSRKIEGGEATTPAQEVHHGSLHPSKTAAHKRYNPSKVGGNRGARAPSPRVPAPKIMPETRKSGAEAAP